MKNFDLRIAKRTTSLIYDTWAGHYNNIIKDYIADIYPDVVETFLGATIKVQNLSQLSIKVIA